MYFQPAYAHQLEHYHIFVENGWFKKDWSVKTYHDFSFFIFSLILQKIMKTMRIIITLHFSVLLIRNLLLWLTTSHIVWMLQIDLFFSFWYFFKLILFIMVSYSFWKKETYRFHCFFIKITKLRNIPYWNDNKRYNFFFEFVDFSLNSSFLYVYSTAIILTIYRKNKNKNMESLGDNIQIGAKKKGKILIF